MALFASGSLGYGHVWGASSPIPLGGQHGAASAFFGVDSFLGPAYLGLGVNDEGDANAYLMIGRPW